MVYVFRDYIDSEALILDIVCNTAVIKVAHKSRLDLTKDTPYLDFSSYGYGQSIMYILEKISLVMTASCYIFYNKTSTIQIFCCISKIAVALVLVWGNDP